MHLFVYGTLRKGGVAAHFLQKFPLVSQAVSLNGFSLYDGGWYPFAVPAPEPFSIIGDIFDVPDSSFPELDDYEGPEYRRIFLEDRKLLIYLKASPQTAGLVKVEGGDWLKYWQRKTS